MHVFGNYSNNYESEMTWQRIDNGAFMSMDFIHAQVLTYQLSRICNLNGCVLLL